MIEQSLDGLWHLREPGTDEWLDARVPGGVHLDLIAAGRIEDPFVGDAELRVQWVAERAWEYRREFTISAAVAAREHVELVFAGLDTLAEVQVNGERLGRADNMFRSWRWDVTGLLRPGSNELRVVFESAVVRGRELEATRFLDSANNQLAGAPHLRKSPSHFGWDWGPKLPNIGFWQGVRLEAWSEARFADVRVSQAIENGAARVSAEVTIERSARATAEPVEVRLRLTHPDGRVELVGSTIAVAESAAQIVVEVARPELWWPNGLGGQPLYRVEIELSSGDELLDARTLQIGLRTLQLRRDKDEWGESFEFVVNGVPVFAKGSNWIPADSFPARATAATVTRLLEAAASANHNMIRIWGGGYYETEAFYDACDRLGILVWQDMMFACSVYPLDDVDFLASVRDEVREQVRRLRHHACLALWCGNNELEVGWAHWNWDRPEMAGLKTAYVRLFDEALREWIAAEDGATPYWVGSPASGPALAEPVSDRAGDYHEWKVWHELAPFHSYTRKNYRFVSEFGFESLPAMATIAEFAPDPADWDLGSPVLDHHQRCPDGNARIAYYLAGQFRIPRDFGGMVYLSQVLQAEAMRVGVEHWRRERARCGGALYWQLNDCWPVSSWSSIDYFGRWKALHYASRRFYAPVLLSVAVADTAADIWVTNDLAGEWNGEVRWSLERLDGEVVAAGAAAATVGPTSSDSIAGLRLPESPADRREIVLVSEFCSDGRRVALVVTPLVPDKHLALRAPKIAVSVAAAGRGLATVRLRSDTLARWVELSLADADVVFSDNYFDLPAGREVTVEFELPAGWDVERARGAIRVRSVADTYMEPAPAG